MGNAVARLRNIGVNPSKWNEHPSRQSVFCASLADVFDNQVPDQWRCDLFELMDCTSCPIG
jgi:hypothetical protein